MSSIADIVTRNIGSVHKTTRAGLRALRALVNSRDEAEARKLFASIAPSPLTVREDEGYARFSCKDLGLEELAAKICELGAEWRQDKTRNGGDKPFLINLLKPADLVEIPEILQFAMHPVFFGAAAAYLQQTPWLVAVSMWLSAANDTTMRSQLYHYDHKDTRQFKIFVNLDDVDADCGPLHFLPIGKSLLVDRAIGYSQNRYSDEDVYRAVDRSDVIAATGPKGMGYVVDTARCLHYGSRGNSRERLVLMISYARKNCVNPGEGSKSLDPAREQLVAGAYRDDPARRFSLSLR